MRVQILVSAAALLLLGACGSDDATGPGEGSSSATGSVNIGNPVSRAFNGSAAFGVDNTDPEVGFALGIVEPGNAGDDLVVFHRAQAGRPTGATAIGDGTAEQVPEATLIGTVILDANAADPLVCLSVGGTFTVTSGSASRLEGTFTMQVDCVRAVSGAELENVTVSGTFDAAGGSVVVPD